MASPGWPCYKKDVPAMANGLYLCLHKRVQQAGNKEYNPFLHRFQLRVRAATGGADNSLHSENAVLCKVSGSNINQSTLH